MERDMTVKEVALCLLASWVISGPILVGFHTYQNHTCRSRQVVFVVKPRTDCPKKAETWFE